MVLTATLYKGMVTQAKSFSFTVLALPDPNIEAVEMASNDLQIELRGQATNAITNHIGLTNLGAGDVMISWKSSSNEIIATNGMVTQAKTFTLTVLAIEPHPNESNANLIDVTDLEELDAIRYDLDGDGLVDTNVGTNGSNTYHQAFPGLTTNYRGYELLTNLDFSGSQWSG